MNRRQFLLAGGGTVAAVAGGTAVASATRADILADGELSRGEGDPATVERPVTRDSVEYLEPTDEVREDGRVQPFERWARRESEAIGARAILPVVEGRLGRSVEGVGSGVRYLLFGPVVSVDHTVTRDREGSPTGEPNVSLDRLRSVAPRTLAVTVGLEGREFTRSLPVGVAHAEVSADWGG